jgi:hypothetical protein
MPPQINLNELYSMQKKKNLKRIQCFDKILELCHKRIRMVSSYNGLNTFYEIPGFIIGFPLYNLEECLEYTVDSLRKNGFLVQILPKPHIAVIYISWDPNELKPPKAIKQSRPKSLNGIQNNIGLIGFNGKTEKKNEPFYLSTLRLF